jgi:hypothetical protein
MAFATTTTLEIKMVGTVFNSATTALASLCITDAENEIKKRLAKRYDFSSAPFLTTTTYPPVIVSLTETLAIGYMYENMARGGKESYIRSDKYIKRVMDNLTELNEGSAQLIGVDGVPVEELTEGEWQVFTTDQHPNTFNEDDPKHWRVSKDKLDDISDERDE